MPLSNLPSQLEGARLVQLSDLHIGPRVADDYLRRAFARAESLEPDFVVITGDFTSFETGNVRPEITLFHLERA